MGRDMKQAAQEALDVQDACNLSGVVGAFHRCVMNTLWPEARRIGQGTDWVNTHPIVTLYLDKLADLNCPSRQCGTIADFGPAYLEVCRIAESADDSAVVTESTEVGK